MTYFPRTCLLPPINIALVRDSQRVDIVLSSLPYLQSLPVDFLSYEFYGTRPKKEGLSTAIMNTSNTLMYTIFIYNIHRIN